MARELDELGLDVQWQQVEDGRANVLGTWPGEGGGPTLMFNGHMDTSYSGEEPWLRGIPGFQPEGFERDGRIYGLGISNMKGALACYVEAVRSLIEDGVRLKGDVLIAAVAGEIEKTQQGDAQGAEYRGYAAGSRYLVGHGGAADICILGEPTENKLVLAHFGTLWLRLRVAGPFIHTAFSMGRLEENSIVRMRAGPRRGCSSGCPTWEDEMSYGDVRGVANVGAIQGGFGWRASRTPHATDLFLDLRVPPDVPMAEARAQGARVRPQPRRGRGRGVRHGAGRRDRRVEPARGRGRRRARGGLRRGARARRHALVLGRVRALALRDRDAQLRHVLRAPRRRARREPRDRRAREDRRGLRAGGAEGLRMRLVTYDGGKVGRLEGEEVVRLDVADMRTYFERGGADDAAERTALAEVDLEAPIVPKKFFHTAGNFREHEEESKRVDWSHAIAPWIVFFQNVDAIVGPDDPVVYPEHLTEELDYELELAVVIGEAGQVVPARRRRWTTSAAT